jgi:hypothetical protein
LTGRFIDGLFGKLVGRFFAGLLTGILVGRLITGETLAKRRLVDILSKESNIERKHQRSEYLALPFLYYYSYPG